MDRYTKTDTQIDIDRWMDGWINGQTETLRQTRVERDRERRDGG